MKQITLALIKPDAVLSGCAGQLITEMEQNFTIGEMHGCKWPADLVREFYSEHKDRPFFLDLIAFMVSGPIIAVSLVGDDAVARWRTLMGATDPKAADPGTIRQRFGSKDKPIMYNAVHGSDSEKSALREIDVIRFAQVATHRHNRPARVLYPLPVFGDGAVRLVKE